MNRIIITTLALVAAIFLSAVYDQNKGSISSLMAADREIDELVDVARPAVQTEAYGIFVAPPTTPNFVAMNFRLFDEHGNLVFQTRSESEVVSVLSADLDNGHYRYEAVTVFQLGEGPNERGADSRYGISRNFGRFFIYDGAISLDSETAPQKQKSGSELGVLDSIMIDTARLLAYAVSVFVPEAAADTFPWLQIESESPEFFLDDTDHANDFEWAIQGYSNAAGDYGTFRIFDFVGANATSALAILSNGDGNDSSFDSFVTWANGDVSLANGGLYFHREDQVLSIGTSTIFAGGDVNIAASDPQISMISEVYSDAMGVEYDGSWFNTFFSDGLTKTRIARVNYYAPEHSLVVDSSGWVGLGTRFPDATLNVVRPTDARIQVNNTEASPPAGDQVMFQLQSAAANKVRFVIGNANGLWTFDNGGTAFQINRAGTGVNEFRVEADGDIVVLKNSYAVNHVNTSSRKAKTDFAPVDEIAILQKLNDLPMSTWRYKSEGTAQRHLGPVAEDFAQAFGLSDGEHISTVDASGVALTAVKGLNQVLRAEIARLQQDNSQLKERLERLESLLLRHNEVAYQ